jgi:hypothetical protein
MIEVLRAIVDWILLGSVMRSILGSVGVSCPKAEAVGSYGTRNIV